MFRVVAEAYHPVLGTAQSVGSLALHVGTSEAKVANWRKEGEKERRANACVSSFSPRQRDGGRGGSGVSSQLVRVRLIFQLASTSRFLLLRSLCMIFLEWRNAMARATSAAICTRSFHAISTSGFFKYRRRSPPGHPHARAPHQMVSGGPRPTSAHARESTGHVFGDEVDVGPVGAHADELHQVRVRVPARKRNEKRET